jgi:hypothetical protein
MTRASPDPARGENEDRFGTGRFRDIRACHRGRGATRRKAVQNNADLQEIQRADLGTDPDLLLRLRRVRRRYHGQDIRSLPAADAALAIESNRLIRTQRSFAIIGHSERSIRVFICICRRSSRLKTTLPFDCFILLTLAECKIALVRDCPVQIQSD